MVASDIAHVTGPLQLVKMRVKEDIGCSMHGILRRVAEMEGSQNADKLCNQVSDDANEWPQLSSVFYQQLFAGSSEGYIVQARLLRLHVMMTSPLPPPPEHIIL